jgi:hypothetical protein
MWHQASRGKGNKKMKGLVITILLAILEIGAIATSSGDLLTDGLEQAPAIRKEEGGVQSELLVDAERPEVADGQHLGFSKNLEGRPA